MKSDALSNKPRRPRWWRRVLRAIGAATGLLGADPGARTSAAAQASAYRPAEAAPAAWLDYAKDLQSHFQQRLTADDEGARRFQEFMTKRAGAASAPSPALVVRTWIEASGKIARIEFDGLDDDAAAIRLRALLARADAGAPPPAMLQPLRLRLSLRLKDQPGQGD